MWELGTDLHEGYLTALTTSCPLQWDHPPFLQVGFLQGSPSQRSPKHQGCQESCSASWEVILAQVEMSCVCCKHFYTALTVKEQQLLF